MHRLFNKLLPYMLIATLIGCTTQQNEQVQQTRTSEYTSGGQRQCSRVEVRQNNGKTEVQHSTDC
ncbi:hypothetical protein CEN45_12525 [Fischerella thermalis CCMEE 5198]|uniref:Uncharacterized protein n=1 Tax=Fischerella thermalis CCMEE 5268 TaxID=2019662 RepID=A0A2N6KC70_9CYAN|nr:MULTISPECIES: hypothetical protein [Fischerella]PMA00001.1 hypothetical protein CI594_10700 [Fischerella thermalis CCMEE 5196]PMB49600.1 hypothetical protein CEN40_04430 [Fischerella thermalis CCMEE 5205]PMB53944.1 hypothetical protein CEN39_01665 [Fischerella thermalis CCMEE 5201]PLZ96233.1 hypothetical protein CEN50_19375 [Fischerella thermalis CCMEE 5268]PMB22429.1 hypothetical protein CEN45_12525 [Fischerella thermalis CCMEE 5198]